MPDPVLQSEPHPLPSVEWSGGQAPAALGLHFDVMLTQFVSRSADRHPPGLEGHCARNSAEQHSASTASHWLGVMALQLRHRPEPSQCSPSGHSVCPAHEALLCDALAPSTSSSAARATRALADDDLLESCCGARHAAALADRSPAPREAVYIVDAAERWADTRGLPIPQAQQLAAAATTRAQRSAAEPRRPGLIAVDPGRLHAAGSPRAAPCRATRAYFRRSQQDMLRDACRRRTRHRCRRCSRVDRPRGLPTARSLLRQPALTWRDVRDQ